MSRRSLGAVLLVVALILAVVASLALGARGIGLGTVLTAVLRPDEPGLDPVDLVVVRELRVPRTAIGLLAGAGLGIAGGLMQGVTRNPIADPGLLGVTAGASFAVVLGIATLGATSPLAYAGLALVGALGASALIAAIATRPRVADAPVLLVVAGSAVTAALTSATSLLLLSDPETLDRYRFWTVGALTARGFDEALALAPLLAAGLGLALLLARPLDALALGDDVARGLGYRLGRTRALSLLGIVLLAGTATALAGPLVFVGLVGAHLARRLLGPRHGALLPFAGVAGATLVLVADTLGRLVAPPGEIEAGIVVAVLGAPVLIALVRSRTGAAL